MTTVFPLVRPIEINGEYKEGISAIFLAQTGPESWVETDQKSVEQGKVSFQQGKDRRGPVPMMVAVSREDKDEDRQIREGDGKITEGRIVVIGDSDFASDDFLDLLGNKKLLLSTINWLARAGNLISIHPPPTKRTPPLTANQARMFFWIPIVFEPLLFLIIGVGIDFKQRFYHSV